MRFSLLLASITVSAGLGWASSAEASNPADLSQPDVVERSVESTEVESTGREEKPAAAVQKPSMSNAELKPGGILLSAPPAAIMPEKPVAEPGVIFSSTHEDESVTVVPLSSEMDVSGEINGTAIAPDAESLLSPSAQEEASVDTASSPLVSPPSNPIESESNKQTGDDLPTPAPGNGVDPGSPLPSLSPSDDAESDAEPRVLIGEVKVIGVDDQPELRNEVYRVIQTRPGRTTTRSQLQDDINAVFSTGFFANVEAEPEDTPLGVRVTFVVQPNPVLRQVQIEDSQLAEAGTTLEFGEQQLTVAELTNAIFAPQYGQTLNLRDFQAGIDELNEAYTENGYVLAQIVDAPNVSGDGVVTLVMAEGIIEDIEVSFLDEDGFPEDEDGNPIEGRTRDFIITREFEAQPGDVFNQNNIQRDLQRVFGLGIFDDVRVSLNPGDDPRKVDVVVNVIEGNTGSIAAGAGFSSASGLFGSASYQQQNLGGNNQKLGTEVQFGQRELLFDIRFTDPWIATDPYRTSYTVNTFLRRSISLIFDGGDREVDLCDNRNDRNCNQTDLTDGDRPRVQRLGGGISFSRPLDEWLGWENWRASTGFQYQRVSIRDSDGDLSYIDAEGNQLSFSDDGQDDLFTLQLAAVRDLRNNPQQPTSGSLLRIGTEQSLPFGSGSILMNRLRGSYSYYIPVELTSFKEGPEALALNVQAGTILGDLPPYEAFSLGGTDSVRGYNAGELGSGRSFVQATAEYRFPLFSILGGALFLDFGSDLGTGDNVPGSPAEVRDKPGSGFGYGLGVRVQSPLGQIRVDYGINDDGDGRIHFGIGERF